MKKHIHIELKVEIPYKEPEEVLLSLRKKREPCFLFESKGNEDKGKESSLVGIDPVLRIKGKDSTFTIEALNERAKNFMEVLSEDVSFIQLCDKVDFLKDKIIGKIEKIQSLFEEGERSKRKNIAQIIPKIIRIFAQKESSFLGLYGLFAYDFIRLFEDLTEIQAPNDINDFEVFLYDTFIHLNLPQKKATAIVFRKSKEESKKAVKDLRAKLKEKRVSHLSYKLKKPKFNLTKKEYKNLVKLAKKYAQKGEIFEVVFSNFLTAPFVGDPLGLYLSYRKVNPSPYLFFFDTGHEQLVGASPEMMVHVKDGKVRVRPISGTARRGVDPVEDHENMLALLNDKKERAELDMLIDLARNDLSRVCKPGLTISDYRFVEKYSKVMHTVAEIQGDLKDGLTGFDALISTLNAGTLTGAPKVAAMNLIEKYEKERRGFYGGVIGYLSFSGEVNTAIIIRTAHIKKEQLRFQMGATLLYKSDPEKEYQETMNKAEAFLTTFN